MPYVDKKNKYLPQNMAIDHALIVLFQNKRFSGIDREMYLLVLTYNFILFSISYTKKRTKFPHNCYLVTENRLYICHESI